jgi:probable DNA repair protein
LGNINWLHTEKLSSKNFQICQKFKRCLEKLSALDQCLDKKYSFHAALQNLEQICSSELFQSESRNEDLKQINILGLLEAAAIDFTHAWICEMNDNKWPNKPAPNPYLSVGLQKHFNMPHASASKELEFSLRLNKRFTNHFDQIIYSYALNEGDSNLKPSTLFRNIKQMSAEALLQGFQPDYFDKNLEHKILDKSKLEYFDDVEALAIDKDEVIKGGQNLLQSQAKCPFSAFAKHRLKLKEMEDPSISINAIDRGNILHELLELFWKKHKNQNNLNALNNTELKTEIEKQSQQIKKDFEYRLPEDKKAIEIELVRAQEITFDFLQLDRNRQNFTVTATEEKLSQNIAGLNISLRADRIDELNDGGQLIIDYKTGKCSTKGWLAPRMEEPQLPLYLQGQKKVQALAYARLTLNKKELGYSGIASQPGIAQGIDDCHDSKKRSNKHFNLDWETLRQSWQEDLETSSESFQAGLNLVNPKDNKSCDYCEFSTICRVSELKE